MEFSTKLRNLRIQRGLTQMELAKLIGTSQSSITAWEQARREPDFSTIQRLADFFNVPMSALLPSRDVVDESYINHVGEALTQNKKLKTLFETAKNFNDDDMNVLILVANSISGRRNA